MFDTQMIIEAVNQSPFAGSGAARSVYALNEKMVVKIPDRGGLVQSWHEIEFYDQWKEHYGYMMAEIYGYITIDEKPWIFMEYVECLDMPVYDYIDENYKGEEREYWRQEVEDFIDETDLGDSDCNSSNWGITDDGRLVAIDLGINRYEWIAYDCYDDYGYNEDYYCYSYG